MPYLFSASRLTFFHTEVPCADIPGDVVEITDEAHEALMEDLLMRGKILQADDQGAPEAVPRGDEVQVPGAESDEQGSLSEAVPNTAQGA